MTTHLCYRLDRGFVHNWLVAGPLATPVADLTPFTGADFKAQIARHFHTADSQITETPAERATVKINETELMWRYAACADDHFVDLSRFYHICHLLQSWAYAEVEARDAGEATFTLTTNGPAEVWINGEHVHRQEHFCHQIPCSDSFVAAVQKGFNTILVRFEAVAVRECPYAMALHVDGIATDAAVRLPTLVEDVPRRQRFEHLFARATLDRDVYTAEDEIVVRWPDEPVEEDDPNGLPIAVRLQRSDGRTYAETMSLRAKAGTVVTLGRGRSLPNGSYQVVIQPRPEEFFRSDLKLQRRLDLAVQKNHYSQAHYGSYESRCEEALAHAATEGSGLYSEIAKMELGRWSALKVEVILEVIESINARADCSDFYLVGLLGMLDRYGGEAEFPHELRQPLEACILNFRYWMDEPGDDAMCFWSENHQILFHACEILAGQRYFDRIFTNNGQSGQWHRQRGEARALAWLHKRGTGGFREWDSNTYFEEDVLALAHLADLARTPVVREMAAVVLDKLFFSLAVNSFRGVFGSTHGRTYAPFIKGGRREPTSGIGRIAWGTGTFNDRILGIVGLACAATYEVPSLIGAVALDRETEVWNRERHAGEMELACDRATGAWAVNKVTYRTPDFMLCSAQGYQPGAAGYQQHIWQATFGPDAVTFVTHPPCVSEEGSHRPNFWHGNAILPRVAQWKDVLIDVRSLPDDDWMGFTHAYFPTAAFDEYTLRDGWAFARSGDGYLALTAACGLALISTGQSAHRELRSYGGRNVWLCHLGRQALDGSFDAFQEAILALDVRFDDLSVHCQTLRGDTLAFGWQGPLRRNGAEEPISNFNHYENPYCAAAVGDEAMTIQYGEYAMRLELSLDWQPAEEIH